MLVRSRRNNDNKVPSLLHKLRSQSQYHSLSSMQGRKRNINQNTILKFKYHCRLEVVQTTSRSTCINFVVRLGIDGSMWVWLFRYTSLPTKVYPCGWMARALCIIQYLIRVYNSKKLPMWACG